MSDALWISVGAVGIVAVIVAVVTWMLFSPARGVRHAPRVRPGVDPPLARALRLAEGGGPPPVPACADDEALEREVLLRRWRDAEACGDADLAVRLAQVLLARGEGDPEVARRAESPVPTLGDLAPVGDEAWIEAVAAPSLDRALTGIMALLGPEVITWAAHPASGYGLFARERAEELRDVPRLVTLAPAVARAVGVASPRFYVTPERPARLVHINLAVGGRYVAALAVGQEALAIEDEAVMRFMLGRKLTFMREEHLVCTAVEGPEELRALHLAAGQILDPGTLPEPPEQVAGLSRPEALSRLRAHFGQAKRAQAMRRLLRSAAAHGEGSDPARVERWEQWLVASAETSFRFGLLMSGSLLAAIRILDLDGVIPGTQREHAQCYQALYGFYLSPEYARLRASLLG